jgi:hypothetical protein
VAAASGGSGVGARKHTATSKKRNSGRVKGRRGRTAATQLQLKKQKGSTQSDKGARFGGAIKVRCAGSGTREIGR